MITKKIDMKQKKNRDRWVVWVPTKGYVKRWLLANFNRPDEHWQEIVNLSSCKELAEDFKKRLVRHEARRDKIVKGHYTTRVAIEITEDTFNRYGWSLTPTEALAWNSMVERKVKMVLHTYNSMLSITGLPIRERIKRFRLATGITELDWDTDSIRKELQRNSKVSAEEDFEQIVKKIEQKCWALLSKNGLVTEQGIMEYEKD